jgi:citrate synthase
MTATPTVVNVDQLSTKVVAMTDGRAPLTAIEAAERLGVKRQTLYAYVSRGLLTSRPTASGRGSEFDAAEVDGLVRRSRLGRQTAQELTIATGVTSLAGGVLRYRGQEVPPLASSVPYEAVANLLWTGEREWAPFVAAPAALAAARRAVEVLPASARLLDRLRVAVDVAAVTDSLRFDLSPPSVLAAGRSLLGVLGDVLPRPARRPVVALELPGQPARPDALAARLWPRLAARRASAPAVRALNGALVLMADHELATSTFAARVAASARANPYAVVGSGLGALDGPLHGLVAELVHRLLVEAERGDVDAAVSGRLRHGERLPGFGHAVYPDRDPRAPALLALVAEAGLDDVRFRLARDVLATVEDRTGVAPNTDFAIGTLLYAAHMPADAGEAIFAIARCAGWIAHALEEYGEAPLRFRLRAASHPSSAAY